MHIIDPAPKTWKRVFDVLQAYFPEEEHKEKLKDCTSAVLDILGILKDET